MNIKRRGAVGLGKSCCCYCFEMRRTYAEINDRGKEPIREECSEAIGKTRESESWALDAGKSCLFPGDRKAK